VRETHHLRAAIEDGAFRGFSGHPAMVRKAHISVTQGDRLPIEQLSGGFV
jgi:hypothetical protein